MLRPGTVVDVSFAPGSGHAVGTDRVRTRARRAIHHRRGESMEGSGIGVTVGKEIAPEELAALFGSVGWGEARSYSMDVILLSLASYPFIAHARDQGGRLVGYVSAF